jgi:hypothetical protein
VFIIVGFGLKNKWQEQCKEFAGQMQVFGRDVQKIRGGFAAP